MKNIAKNWISKRTLIINLISWLLMTKSIFSISKPIKFPFITQLKYCQKLDFEADPNNKSKPVITRRRMARERRGAESSVVTMETRFLHKHFYTQTLLHTDAFTHRRFLHTGSFTHRDFYTQTLLHTEAFTHKRFHT